MESVGPLPPESAILLHFTCFHICYDYLYTVTSGDQFDNLQQLPRYLLAAPTINCLLVWLSVNKISNEVQVLTTFHNSSQ